jgi:hypothetical protein
MCCKVGEGVSEWVTGIHNTRTINSNSVTAEEREGREESVETVSQILMKPVHVRFGNDFCDIQIR